MQSWKKAACVTFDKYMPIINNRLPRRNNRGNDIQHVIICQNLEEQSCVADNPSVFIKGH